MTRWFTRAALAAMALLMAAPAPAAERVDRRETNFQVSALVPGLGNRYRPGRLFPIAVELSVLATRVSGTIEVQTQTQSESIPIYTAAFDLSPGASYRYYLYPRCENLSDSYTLTIRDANGRELRQEQLAMKSHETGTYLAATIGHEDVAGLGPTQQNDQRIGLQSVPLQMDFMPPKCSGWDPADAVIWPHPDPSGMSAAQQKALTDWVLGGGRLILAPGDSWQAVAKTFLSDFVPGAVTGLEVTPYLDKLAAYGGAQFDGDARMSIAVLKNPVGEVLVWSESRPLVVRCRMGFGEVIFLAFDPTKSPFARWRGSQAFWENVLALKRPARTESQQSNQQGNYFNPYGSYGVSDTLANSLGEFPKVKPISFTFVVFFLLIYVILIGPVDYFVLKRLKHLEWTWFTFPAVALVATGIAFWTISSTRTAQIYINQLSVMDWSADGKSERSHDVAVLLSPTNQRYDVTFKNAGGELFLMENHRDPYGGMGGGFNISATTFRMDDAEDGPVARSLLIPVWSTRTFSGCLRQNAKTNVPFSASLSVVGDHLEGSVTSHALDTLTGVAVIHKTGVYTRGASGGLGPGETWQLVPKQRRKLADFYNDSRRGAVTNMQGGGGTPDRTRARDCAVFSTVAYDSRFFPAMYYQNENYQTDDERYSFDLPPEWSLRSSIEAGEAVVIGTISRCAPQLNIGSGNIERYERTVYRVCAEAK